MRLIDVKSPPPASGGITTLHYPSGYPISRRPPVFLCPSPGPDPYRPHQNHASHHHRMGGTTHRLGGASHHLYEELSEPADDDMSDPPLSEDDFAEDELSLAGEADGRRLDGPPPPPYREEDELVMDAGGVIRRDVGSVEPPGVNNQNLQTQTANRRVIPSITHRLQCMGQAPSAVGPYESVPVIGHHLATFRPLSNHNHKPYSHDSAIGSDSGYSNHTGGTR
ncbi:unnamed protein product [Acanthoscelides obtectus]|uniref:Uncharacterized protein n=1 Tax=Acanthoscelides obtectus TaxID=200917 RepID=A0A9P0PR13_ACAOB|nr:unnamed protein product [Acanthoscelides obtectus]CAK1656544.1 hypothetical protein AOBTE_LOCUS19792 [Acanthoscelides obtectus]